MSDPLTKDTDGKCVPLLDYINDMYGCGVPTDMDVNRYQSYIIGLSHGVTDQDAKVMLGKVETALVSLEVIMKEVRAKKVSIKHDE